LKFTLFASKDVSRDCEEDDRHKMDRQPTRLSTMASCLGVSVAVNVLKTVYVFLAFVDLSQNQIFIAMCHYFS